MAKIDLDRKSRIINAAIKLFIQQGAAFTKLSEVAKSAKVPAPLIHYYYKTVEDLHFDVIQAAYQDLKIYNHQKSEEQGSDAAQMMAEYLKGPLLWAKERPGHYSIWLYFYYMASWSDQFEALHTEIRNGGRARISLIIYRGIEKKVFKIPHGRTVEELAHWIQSQITGQFVMYGSEKKVRPFETFVRELEVTVFQALGVRI